MSQAAQSWQQPRPASGWGRTLRRWGPRLVRVTPFALGFLIPSPLAMALAGTGLVSGVAGTIATLRGNPWRDFQPEPGELWDPDADELPEPGLQDALGLTGFRIDGVLRAGDGAEAWLAFQSVDRLGGRSTRVVVRLPGRATVPLDMVGPTSRNPRASSAASTKAFGRYRPARGPVRSARLHLQFSSEQLRSVLSEATVQSWSLHEQYLVGELYALGAAALRVNLIQSLAWLRRLRDALPDTLVQRIDQPEAAPEDVAGGP